MNRLILLICIYFVAIFSLTGCATFRSSAHKLSPGMTHEEANKAFSGLLKNAKPDQIYTLNSESVWSFKDGFAVFRDEHLTHFGLESEHVHFLLMANSLKSTEDAPGKKVVLLAGAKEINVNDLQTQEYFHDVALVLKHKGYSVVSDAQKADVAVLINYGISDPQSNTYSEPVYGMISGGSTSTVHARTDVNISGTSNGGYNSYSGTGSGTTTGTVSTSPVFGFLGMQQRTLVTYTRWLSLSAFDYREYLNHKKEKQVWRAMLVSTGSSGDLRAIFPYLAVGISDFINTNSEKQVRWLIFDNDPRLSWFSKDSMAQPSISDEQK